MTISPWQIIDTYIFRAASKATPDEEQKPDAAGDKTTTNKICQKGKEKDRLIGGRGEKLGYCEVCQVNFYELLHHITSQTHKEQVSDEHIWKQLDDCMIMANNYHNTADETLECSV